MNEKVETEKLRIEQEKLQQEMTLRREELQLRRLEIEAAGGGRWGKISSTVVVAVIPALSGILGVLGAVGAQWFQGRTSIEVERERSEASITLEKQKFASSLVLKALENPNTEESGKTLLFLVNTGMLEDKEGKIREAVSEPGKVPVIEPMEKRLAQMEIQLGALDCQVAGKTFDLGSMKCVEVPLRGIKAR